jgi:hypothetical protein
LLLHTSYLPLGVPNGLVKHHAQGRLLPQQLHATTYFLAPSPSSTPRPSLPLPLPLPLLVGVRDMEAMEMDQVYVNEEERGRTY